MIGTKKTAVLLGNVHRSTFVVLSGRDAKISADFARVLIHQGSKPVVTHRKKYVLRS
jgi:hypothetical protein